LKLRKIKDAHRGGYKGLRAMKQDPQGKFFGVLIVSTFGVLIALSEF
jgi:hypothetical protein